MASSRNGPFFAGVCQQFVLCLDGLVIAARQTRPHGQQLAYQLVGAGKALVRGVASGRQPRARSMNWPA